MEARYIVTAGMRLEEMERLRTRKIEDERELRELRGGVKGLKKSQLNATFGLLEGIEGEGGGLGAGGKYKPGL